MSGSPRWPSDSDIEFLSSHQTTIDQAWRRAGGATGHGAVAGVLAATTSHLIDALDVPSNRPDLAPPSGLVGPYIAAWPSELLARALRFNSHPRMGITAAQLRQGPEPGHYSVLLLVDGGPWLIDAGLPPSQGTPADESRTEGT